MSWGSIANFFNTTHNSDGTTTYGPGFQFINDIWQGAKNSWYNLTGQPEKTSSYQHLEEREDTAYQRAAADMAAAGLSKYQGVAPAQSSSAGQSDPVAKAMEKQQLKSMKIANDEAEYSLGLSKALGIRPGDTNYAAKWAELGNVLFGFDPTKVEGGLVPWVFQTLSGLIHPKSSEPPESSEPSGSSELDFGTWESGLTTDSPVMVGASSDQVEGIAKDLESLVHQGPEAIEKFVTGMIKKVESTGVGKTANYSTLPEDEVLGVFGRDLIKDVEHFRDELISKGITDELTVNRIAQFIADKYSADYNDVKRMLTSKITEVFGR